MAPREGNARMKRKFAVVPCTHKLAHGLKNVGARFGVDVVFSSRNKLSRICSLVHRQATDLRRDKLKCVVKHANRFVPCAVGVVYMIPLSCGKVNIGQTGRCLNIRLREHSALLKGLPYSRIWQHDCVV